MGLTAHLSMFPKLDMQINNKSLDKLSKKELLHLVWKKYTRPVTWDTLYVGSLLCFFLLLKTPPPLLDGIKTRLYVNLPVIIVNAAGHEQPGSYNCQACSTHLDLSSTKIHDLHWQLFLTLTCVFDIHGMETWKKISRVSPKLVW